MSTKRSSRKHKAAGGGCMSGILCLLDCCRRSSHELLMDGGRRTNGDKERYDLLGDDQDSNCYMDVKNTTTSVKMLMEKDMVLPSSSYKKKIRNPATEPNSAMMLWSWSRGHGHGEVVKSSFGVSFREFRKKLGHGDVGGNNRRHRRWLFGGKKQVNKRDTGRESKRHFLDIFDGGDDDSDEGVGCDGQQVQVSLDKKILTSSSDYFLSKSPIFSPGRYKDPGVSPRRLPFFPTYGGAGGNDGNMQQGSAGDAFGEFDGRVETSISRRSLPGRHKEPGLSPRRMACSPPRISSGEEDETSMVNRTSVNKESPSPEMFHIDHYKTEEGIIIGKPDGPSPISVLELPFSSDDVASPESAEDAERGFSSVITEASSGGDGSGLPVSPRLIHFDDYLYFNGKDHLTTTCMEDEEFKHGYVISLLEASCLINCETWELRSPYSHDQLFDPKLYNQVKTPTSEAPDDLKLLFDCINEVLVNIHRKYFSHPLPPPPSIKHGIFPSPESLVGEVLKGINCDFNTSETPPPATTLYEIIGKDLGSTSTSWICMVSGIDHIGKTVGDQILEDTLKETASLLVLSQVS